MHVTSLGSTPIRISRIGLGAMPLSVNGRPDRDQAKAVVRAADEAGVTLIDTADVYCLDEDDHGHNERLIAEALAEMGLRVDAVTADAGAPLVATKGGRRRPGGDWTHAARPDQLRVACEASLAALETDRIRLYQLHAPDPDVPLAESVGELGRLRDEGKIAHVGLSNVTVDQIQAARREVPIVSVQNFYNPWTATGRPSPVIALCEREGITFMAYSPLGGRDRVDDIGRSEELRRIGHELDATPHEVVLAFLIELSPAVVPIPGASRPASIVSSARAGSMSLDSATMGRIRGAMEELPGQPSLLSRVLGRMKRMLPG